MKLLLLVFLSFFLLSLAEVIELDDDFESVIGDKPALIELYAPWCQHCKNLEPLWIELGETLADRDIVVAKIDATKAKNAAKAFGVRGFPTIVFKEGKFIKDYSGPRDVPSFVSFVDKMTQDPIPKISEEYKHSVTYNTFVVPQNLSPEIKERLSMIARTLVGIVEFFEADESRFQQLCSTDNLESLCVLKEGEPIVTTDLSDEGLAKWIVSHLFSSLPQVDQENFRLLAEKGTMFVIAVNPEMEEELEDIRNQIKSSGLDLTFAWMDATQFRGYLERIGLDLSTLPNAFALNIQSRNIWKKSVDQELFDWAVAVQEGKVEPEGAHQKLSNWLNLVQSVVRDHPIAVGAMSVTILGLVVFVIRKLIRRRYVEVTGEEEEEGKQDKQD
ncbi:hypothetical protein GEMRC1_007466 [Eukaryota sp. GEM-RC1]